MEGQMETTDDRMKMFSPQQIEKLKSRSSAIKKHMSGRGELGLSPHLDARRLEFGITDGAFKHQAAFDRILVHQIPMAHFMGGKYGEGSLIHLPESSEKSREISAPRGIIVSAGLRALDELQSNGIEVGDIVITNHVSPWRIEVDLIDGHLQYLQVMHAGHVISSEDTAIRLRKRELFIEGPVTAHVYVNRGTGERPEPVVPAMLTSEEY